MNKLKSIWQIEDQARMEKISSSEYMLRGLSSGEEFYYLSMLITIVADILIPKQKKNSKSMSAVLINESKLFGGSQRLSMHSFVPLSPIR